MSFKELRHWMRSAVPPNLRTSPKLLRPKPDEIKMKIPFIY